jgi:putative FmdB family regulatory protein
MPVFEFACDFCGTRRDVFVRGVEKAIVVCEKCGEKMRQQLSAPAVIFKGSGFYTTDYGKGKTMREAAKREESGVSCSDEKDSKSDGARAAKREDKDAKKEAKPEVSRTESEKPAGERATGGKDAKEEKKAPKAQEKPPKPQPKRKKQD